MSITSSKYECLLKHTNPGTIVRESVQLEKNKTKKKIKIKLN